ncbi:hypothetical protein D3C86_2115990 [compost metagenome]
MRLRLGHVLCQDGGRRVRVAAAHGGDQVALVADATLAQHGFGLHIDVLGDRQVLEQALEETSREGKDRIV